MDKGILKKFAIEARQDLMKMVENQLKMYYVDEEFEKTQTGDLIYLKNSKHSLPPIQMETFKKREALIKRIYDLEIDNDFEKGKKQVIEEVAYTWFNRIIAIRYMEINDMLPLTKDNQSLGIRVLSSQDNTPNPEIMKKNNLTNSELDLDINIDEYYKFEKDKDKFNYILKKVCKKLGEIIPQVFDGNTDYIDILIPNNLLQEGDFINKLLKDVPEENFKDGVEIIGWLYQYYNQTEKDRVISAKKAYKKNEIAYATQLFTPDWIVKYMVENSLGKYWIEHNREDEVLINNWKYFIKDNLEYNNEKLDPRDIKFIDPCCGSGHILVYAFEILYQLYERAGYSKNDIPELILKNNLYGLDIDDRAGQLSILSVILKAREYDKNIFNKGIIQDLNIMSIQESNNIKNMNLDFVKSSEEREQAEYLLNTFENAKEIGSLLIVKDNDYTNLENSIINDNSMYSLEAKSKLLPIIKIANILSKKYDIVVTNPPYLNNSVMSSKLKKYIQSNYKEVKSDMFSAFIIKNSKLGSKESYLGFMTPYVWMFISSYEKLREYIIDNLNISSLIQLEYSALEEATVPICTFILKNNKESKSNGVYFRLVEYKGGMIVQEQKYLENLKTKKDVYDKNSQNFDKIPGKPFAYWISDNLIKCFDNKQLSDYGVACVGLQTSDNKRFLREWYEVDINKIGFNIPNIEESIISKKKWFPYNKGGEYRKWYGNNIEVVNWENDGAEIREYNNYLNSTRSSNIGIANTQYYFKESGTWGLVSSAKFSVRYSPVGAIFDTGGSSLFSNNIKYLVGLLNTNLVQEIMHIQNPTLNFQPGNVAKIPIIIEDEKNISDIVDENIQISKKDWDSFETSYDFERHPLIYEADMPPQQIRKEQDNGFQVCNNLEEAYEHWVRSCNARFKKLKENEEELNRIFIDIYGLQDELTTEEEDKDVTVRKADRTRDIKSFISYAVGCMFGRYSLDEDGLIYAGGEFDKSKYKTYEVDEDNIIPITDEAYLKDDIVEKFKNFVEIVYGKETLEENLDYIADSLGRKNGESSEQTIRRYFLNDFYKDHIQIYKKKPIYWLFDSGKKNGFKALIYMHRYNENIVGKIRKDYLYKMQRIYETRLEEIKKILNNPEDSSTYELRKLEKEQHNLTDKLVEIKEYNEKLISIGDTKIKIDLDDGVSVNYSKFTYIDPITNKESNILANAKDIVPKKKE